MGKEISIAILATIVEVLVGIILPIVLKNQQLVVWIIISIILMLLTWLFFLLWNKRQERPAFLKETQMTVNGTDTWTWAWQKGESADGWRIYDLKPLCPVCGDVMYYPIYTEYYECINHHRRPLAGYSATSAYILHHLRNKYPKLATRIEG